MLTMADIMTPYPLRVERDTTADACAQIMTEHRCRHLPVVQDGGHPVGLVTDLDLFVKPLAGRRAHEIARTPTLIVEAEAPIPSVLHRMLHDRQCVALVIDPFGLLVGIVTSHDLIRLAPQLVDPHDTALSHARSPLHTLDRMRPASEALAIMRDHQTRHVVILSDGLLYGVVSLFDLVAIDADANADLRVDTAIQTALVDHGTEQTTLRTAALMMGDWRIGCLPIVDTHGHVLAALGRQDVLTAVRDAQRVRGLIPAEPPDVGAR